MKPVYCTLREAGHLSVEYIDDSYLQGNDYDQRLENIKATVTLFNTLGLVTHPDKSVLEPTQQMMISDKILYDKQIELYIKQIELYVKQMFQLQLFE